MVYVYFDYKAQQSQAGIHVAKSLLKQLLCRSDNIPSELESLYNESIRTSGKPDIPTFTQLLKLYAQKFSIYAIFDALDECSDDHQKELLSLFADLQKGAYRLLISSRPHLPHLRDRLGSTKTLEIGAEESDLTNYVTARLDNERHNNLHLRVKCIELMKGVQRM